MFVNLSLRLWNCRLKCPSGNSLLYNCHPTRPRLTLPLVLLLQDMKDGRGAKSMFKGRRDRDEDLILFRDLHKRERERFGSLLQPVPDEFDHSNPNGHHQFYRIPSTKRGPGLDFLPENDKHDYNWLKTPPATPLFPSLEMEAKAPELIVQREITVLQPISRLSAQNSEPSKPSNTAPKAPIQKPKPRLRSITPGPRQASSTISTTTTKNSKPKSPTPNQLRESHLDLLASNLSKHTGIDHSNKTKPRSRGVSPLVRSTIPSQIPQFSNETPPNLRTTERSTSATRGRASRPDTAPSTQVLKQEPMIIKQQRQSCSPSVTRGRKVEANNKPEINKGRSNDDRVQGVLGSRMVERVMNARKAGTEEKDSSKAKPSRGSINESSGFVGRMAYKSLPDTGSLKHMAAPEVKRDRMSSRHQAGFGRRVSSE